MITRVIPKFNSSVIPTLCKSVPFVIVSIVVICSLLGVSFVLLKKFLSMVGWLL